jgi:hypothetical protein
MSLFNFNWEKALKILVRIMFKRGLKADINTSITKKRFLIGEPSYTTDTKELFINNGTENVQIPTLPESTDTPFTGTFENGTGGTVTVKNGIITDVS